MKRRAWGAAVLWGLPAAAPGWSFAGRPLLTEDAGTVEKGGVEIELAFDHARDDNGDKVLPFLRFRSPMAFRNGWKSPPVCRIFFSIPGRAEGSTAPGTCMPI